MPLYRILLTALLGLLLAVPLSAQGPPPVGSRPPGDHAAAYDLAAEPLETHAETTPVFEGVLASLRLPDRS